MASAKNAVQEPARQRIGVTVSRAVSKEPESRSLAILDGEIIARSEIAGLAPNVFCGRCAKTIDVGNAPPIRCDRLWTPGAYDFVKPPAPAEQNRRLARK